MPRGMAEQQVWKQNALFLHEGFKGDGPLNVWKVHTTCVILDSPNPTLIDMHCSR